MGRTAAALTHAAFVAQLMPDLVRTAHALYRTFKGDPKPARRVLEIVRDHGARLDEKRLQFDQELAELRAERAREKPDA